MGDYLCNSHLPISELQVHSGGMGLGMHSCVCINRITQCEELFWTFKVLQYYPFNDKTLLSQAEIVKRLNGICAQVLPYLSQEHQQQVLAAIERAKQVTPPEMNSIIRQQLQAHQLSQLQGLALPMTPLPLGLSQPTLPAVTTSSGLFSLSSLLASQAQLAKEEKASRDGVDSHREEDGDKSD
ncbi:TLE family member 5 [Morone saxatilis]|uniref:TLE family member 5 n=1 Tax=Morone saxatilis TaxID=34816 RepID=UPI0015E23B16|nr:TLE family member 5 [Morone saxatilis]